jgi:hypothetical protein
MSMLRIHANALESELPCVHEFRLRYSKNAKVVYGFVEGKEDPSFYRGIIERVLPAEWHIELWPAGSKRNVSRIHRGLDWRSFPKQRICFFVDRDLSDLLGKTIAADRNIYVTHGYSIENEIATRSVCERILSELLGFGRVGHDELDQATKLFESQLERFYGYAAPVMAWILYWQKNGVSASLSNIEMKHLFTLTNGVITAIAAPKGKQSVEQYIHEQCNIVADPTFDNSAERATFALLKNRRRFTRGKVVLWFVVQFCNSVHRGAAKLFSGLTQPPKANVVLSVSNGMALIGPRCRTPSSLAAFLRGTYQEYIMKREEKKR